MIEQCDIGRMKVSGRTYDSDLWIFPDQHVQDAWWRKDGHRLHRGDIAALIETRPEVLVVGTGIYGRMLIDRDVEPFLTSQNIEMKSARTQAAAELYNQLLKEGRNLAACFHLTC